MAPLRTLLSIMSRPLLSVFLGCGSLTHCKAVALLKCFAPSEALQRGREAGGAASHGIPLTSHNCAAALPRENRPCRLSSSSC